jgi:hypothetical protein
VVVVDLYVGEVRLKVVAGALVEVGEKVGRATGVLVGAGGRGMKVGTIGIGASGLASLFAAAVWEALGTVV